jgi:hypothetical protein
MADSSENNVKQKKTPRKKCLFEKILDWIGLTILFLFVVGLIVLRAPWIVVAVLIAILLVNTVVSKPIRKWIWLTVAIILATFVIWVFLPDDNEGWRPYTFDEELATVEAKRSIPAEENAATIYNQLLKNYDPNSFDKDFFSYANIDLILSEFWTNNTYPEVTQWLKSNQNLIDQLMQASQKNKCCFPLAGDIDSLKLKPPVDFEDVTEFWWSSEKRLTPMRRLGVLLTISANNDVAEGHIDQAIEKYIATIQIAKHLCQQPTPMDLLVGIGINLRGLEQINEFVVTGNATDEQIQLLDDALESIDYDWRTDLSQIFDRQKLMFKSFMCAMFYQINREGKVRLNRDPRSTLRAQFRFIMVSGESGYKPMNPDSYGQAKLTKAMSVLCRAFVPSSPQKTSFVIDDIYKRYYLMADPEFNWQEEYGKFSLKSLRLNFRCLLVIMSRILEVGWPNINDRYLQAVTERRGSQLLIALRRYKNRTGHWPEKLETLNTKLPAELCIDPINNDSFEYRLTDDGFVLYSKGRNKIDENCEHEGLVYMQPCCSLHLSTDLVEDRADDILIWPPEK